MTDAWYRNRRASLLDRCRSWREAVRWLCGDVLDREVEARLLYYAENELRNRQVELGSLRRNRPAGGGA